MTYNTLLAAFGHLPTTQHYIVWEDILLTTLAVLFTVAWILLIMYEAYTE